MGTGSTSSGSSYVVAIGSESKAYDTDSVVIGGHSEVHENATVVGNRSKADMQSVALGSSVEAGKWSVAIGLKSKAKNHAIAMGMDSDVAGEYSIAIGEEAKTPLDKSVSIGYQAKAETQESLAIGDRAVVYGENITEAAVSTAIGSQAKVYGKNAIALGGSANVGDIWQKQMADGGTAIGSSSNAAMENATAIGYKSIAYGKDAVTIGAGTRADIVEGGVALGSESNVGSYVDSKYGIAGKVGYDPLGTDANGTSTWKSTKAAVSVGNQQKDITRQIINVAAGTDNTDAVNVAQLKSLGRKAWNDLAEAKDELGGRIATNTGNITKLSTRVGTNERDIGRLKTDVSTNDTRIRYLYSNMPFRHFISVNEEGTNTTLPNYKNEGAKKAGSIAIGVNTTAYGEDAVALGGNLFAWGQSSVIVGESSDNYTGGVTAKEGQFDQSIILGSNNTIFAQSAENGGREDKIIGNMNRVEESHGTFVRGTGNMVYDAYNDEALTDEDKQKEQDFLDPLDGGDPTGLFQKGRSHVTVEGDGNLVAGSLYTQVSGVGNEVSNSQPDENGPSTPRVTYNIVTGNRNTVADSSHNLIIGDNHELENVNGNIIIGSLQTKAKTEASDVTILGNEANVSVDGGVALGNGSVADRAKKVPGYDPATKAASTENGKEWKSTLAAVSVGNATGTRQITGVAAGSEDTDAVNVAQLRALNQKVDKGTVHYYSVKSDKQAAGTNYANDGAKAADSMVIGISSSTSEKAKNSTVLGNNNTLANQPNARGVERDSKNNSIVVGQNLTVEGARNAVFGTDYQNGTDKLLTHVAGERNTVIGVGNLVGYTAERVGTEWKYTKFKGHGDDENVVVGLTNTVNGGGVVVGTNTTVSAYGGVAFGHHNIVSGDGDKGVALGNDLNVSGSGALAVGTKSAATGDYTIALGVESKAQALMAASMGYDSQAKASGSVALGAWSSAEAKQALALGYDSQAKAVGGVALGAKSVANTEADKIGFVAGGSNATFDDLLTALGKKEDYDGWTAKVDASKAEFDQLTAAYNAAKGSDKATAKAELDAWKNTHGDFVEALSAKTSLETAWKSNMAAVSVGRNEVNKAGNTVVETRQITNLAAGTEDTDAVNVAQLKALNKKVDDGAVHYFSVKADDSAAPADTNWNNDGATGAKAIAIGRGAKANGNHSIALGSDGAEFSAPKTTGAAAIAIGSGAEAGVQDISIGLGAKATGGFGVAIGRQSEAKASTAVAMAYGAKAEGANSLAIGILSDAKTADSAAYGREAKALGDVALAVGTLTKAEGNHSSVFGYKATTDSTAWNGTAIGRGAYIGKQAPDGTTPNIGVSNNYFTPVDDDTAVAPGKETMNSTALGFGAKAFGYQDTALGAGAEAFDTNTVSIGVMSKAIGHYANALGKQARAEGKDSVAIGHWARSIGESSMALGDYAITSTLDGTTSVTKSAAIGSHARAASDNSVALGTNSLANIADDVATKAYLSNEAFAKENGVVSVGNEKYKVGDTTVAKNYRRITNVAGGAADNDAVNVAQLKAVNDKLDTTSTTAGTALQSWDAQIDGEKVKTVDKDNNTLNFVAGKNISLTDESENIKIATSDDVDFNKVTVGGVVIDKDADINAGDKKITHVVAGTADTDAVNVSQLNGVKTDVTNNTKNITALKGGFTVSNAAGTKQDITLGGGTKQNIKFQGEENKIDVAVEADGTAGAKVTVKANPKLGENIDLSNNSTITTINNNITTLQGGFNVKSGTNEGAIKAGETLEFAGKNYVETEYNNSSKTLTIGLDDATKTKIDNISTTIGAAAKWTIQDSESTPGSKTIDATNPLVVQGADGVTAKVDDAGLHLGLNKTDLSNTINSGPVITNVVAKFKVGAESGGDKTVTADKDGTQTIKFTGDGNIIESEVSTDGVQYKVNETKLKNTLSNTFAKTDASNLTGENVTQWREKLGVTNDALSQASAWKLQVNGKNERVIGKDDVVNFVAGSYTEVTATGNDVKIGLNKAAKDKLDKVDTLEGQIKANKVQVTGDAVTGVKVADKKEADGSTTYTVSLDKKIQVGGVAVNGKDGKGEVTGLTNTSLNVAGFATSKRAATEEQLQLAMDQMSANAKITTVESGDENIVVNKTKGQNENKYTVALNKNLNVDSLNAGGTQVNKDGISVQGADGKPGVTITKDGINAGGQTIRNVKPGEKIDDAATVGQLKDLAGAAGNGLNELGNQIGRLDGRVNKVGAGAAALAALHPVDFDADDKLDVAAGWGHYKGRNAMALGAFYRPDERTMFSLGGTVGNGENMINAGITFKLDKRRGPIHAITSKVQLVQEVTQLKADNDELRKDNAELREQMKEINAKLEKLLAAK